MPRLALVLCLSIPLGTLAAAEDRTVEVGTSRAIFLGTETAARAIVDDDGEYFSRLGPWEISIKSGRRVDFTDCDTACARERYRELIAGATLDFSEIEMRAILFALEHVQPYVELNFPRVADVSWRFIRTERWVEGGLPHTRGDAIVFPEKFLEILLSRVDPDSKNISGTAAALLPLLVHEQVHVLQRMHADAFGELYTSWGYTPASVEYSAALGRELALNPDGTSTWVWNESDRWYWPTAGIGMSATDLDAVAVRLEPRTPGRFMATEILPIAQVKQLSAKFGARRGALMHPNEISATAIGSAVSQDMQGGKVMPPADEILAWAKVAFGAEP